jgi:hypothetical protein
MDHAELGSGIGTLILLAAALFVVVAFGVGQLLGRVWPGAAQRDEKEEPPATRAVPHS